MAYSRCGLINALYRGTLISFVGHISGRFMKYSIAPIGDSKDIRGGGKSCFHSDAQVIDLRAFCIDLPSASSNRVRRKSGGPSIDR